MQELQVRLGADVWLAVSLVAEALWVPSSGQYGGERCKYHTVYMQML